MCVSVCVRVRVRVCEREREREREREKEREPMRTHAAFPADAGCSWCSCVDATCHTLGTSTFGSTQFRTRWCVLRGRVLKYYKEDTLAGPKLACGWIVLASGHAIKPSRDDRKCEAAWHVRTCIFGLCGSNSRPRVLALRTPYRAHDAAGPAVALLGI